MLRSLDAQIKHVEEQIGTAKNNANQAADPENRDYWREKEKSLREEKKLLCEKELLLLRRSTGKKHMHDGLVLNLPCPCLIALLTTTLIASFSLLSHPSPPPRLHQVDVDDDQCCCTGPDLAQEIRELKAAQQEMRDEMKAAQQETKAAQQETKAALSRLEHKMHQWVDDGVWDKLLKGSVVIYHRLSKQGSFERVGRGFITHIDGNDVVVTCAHVVTARNWCGQLAVKRLGGTNIAPITKDDCALDTDLDIAIIKVSGCNGLALDHVQARDTDFQGSRRPSYVLAGVQMLSQAAEERSIHDVRGASIDEARSRGGAGDSVQR
eukprot:588635-Rhodomonas_salina.1